MDGFCYSLNLDGSLRWKLRTGGITAASPVIAADGTTYLIVNDQLWLISPEGQKIYSRDAEGLTSTSPVLLADQTFCLLTAEANLIREQPDLRDVRWFVACHTHSSASPAVSSKGVIYLPGGPAWSFSALSPAAPLAPSPWPKFRGNPRNTANAADNASLLFSH